MKIKNHLGIEVDVSEFIRSKIDGEDQDRGQLETTERTADNAAKTIGNLVAILRERNLIDNDDIEKIVYGIW